MPKHVAASAEKRTDDHPFSPRIVAKVGRISKDRKKAIAFLKKGGFLDAHGNLSVKYKPNK